MSVQTNIKKSSVFDLLKAYSLLAAGIRTCLLESDEHVCPTCKQSDASPDALIANKFLRQVRNLYPNFILLLNSCVFTSKLIVEH